MNKTFDILILSCMISIVLTVQTKSESYISSSPKSSFVLSRRAVCIIKDDDIMSKKIHLTQGKFAIVDDEYYEWLNQWKWYASKINNTFYATRCVGKRLNRKTIFMHRLIMNAKMGEQIDHINHNGIDNRCRNLRFCNCSENFRNSIKKEGCTSQFKGVSWYYPQNKWQVYIYNNGKNKNLGTFDNEEDAALAYDKKAKELFGEFANCNVK